MDFEKIFYSFVATDHLTIDNKILTDACLDKIANDPGTVDGQCYIRQEESFYGMPFHDLFVEIQHRVKQLYTDLELSNNYSFQIRNAWCNIDQNENTNSPHCHTESIISGVYYVASTLGSGNIEFISPVAAAPYTFFKGSRERMNGFNAERWEVTPEAGKLIIFPSWLFHRVMPNTDDGTRISIAFNAHVVDQPQEIN
jgi:uncharacterized protein (TIGR02466 family)